MIDKNLLMNGSFSWIEATFSQNAENVMVMNDKTFVDEFGRYFDSLWDDKKRVLSF